MSSSTTPAPLTDREAVIQAVLGFTESLDLNSPSLLRENTTPDFVFDRTALVAALGLGGSGEVDRGQEAVIKSVLVEVGGMTTSHHVSNFRVRVEGEEDGKKEGEGVRKAVFEARALAYHHRVLGRPAEGAGNLYAMSNTYKGEAVRGADGRWRLARFRVEPVWQSGNLAVVKGAAGH